MTVHSRTGPSAVPSHYALADTRERAPAPAPRPTVLHSKTKVVFRRGLAGLFPDAWIIKPTWQANTRPLICVHGIKRDAELMAHCLADLAHRRGRTVIVPHFDEPRYQRYQRAICKDRSDKALLRLIQILRDEQVVPDGPFDLSGFSGGAQFAHRFTWLYPGHVGRLTLCSAGWYTFPDDSTFPYGIGGGSVSGVEIGFCLRSNLHAFLDRPIVVRVGAQDNVVDKTTRQGPEIDAQQGKDRVARARNWVLSLKAAAARHDMVADIDFALLNGCGHDFAECVTKGGLDHVFIGSDTGDMP